MAVFAFEGGDCSGSIVARQTGSKVGRSLTEVPLGSGADEGRRAFWLNASGARSPETHPDRGKEPRSGAARHTRGPSNPRKPHPPLREAPGRAEGRRNTLKMVSVGHVTRRELRTATVSRLSPRALEETFLGTLTNPRGN